MVYIVTNYCRKPPCPLFGHVAPRAQFTWCAWHWQAPCWRYQACRAVVSARTGTAYTSIRTEVTTYLRGAVALAEGLSIRVTGRLLGVDKDTGNHWLPVLGRDCQGVMNAFFRHLHLRECPLDEWWTFVARSPSDAAGETGHRLQRCLGMDRLQSGVQVGPCLGRGKTDIAARPPAGVATTSGDRWAHSVSRNMVIGRISFHPL